MAIGVRAARVAKKLTQEEMVGELNKAGIQMSINTYRSQEDKPGTMDIDTAKAISAITGIPFATIFFD